MSPDDLDKLLYYEITLELISMGFETEEAGDYARDMVATERAARGNLP